MTPLPHSLRTVTSLVEGDGEVRALPVLVRNIAANIDPGLALHVPPPHRVPRQRLVTVARTPGVDLERTLRLQGSRAGRDGLVIVCLDSDDDPSDDLVKVIRGVGNGVVPGTLLAVPAVREFEAWFLASLPTVRQHRDVADTSTFDGDPEQVRGAKEALADRMTCSYREPVHQPAFAHLLDPDLAAERSPSFAAFREGFRRWLDTRAT